MTFKVVFLQSAEEDLKELKTYLVKNFGTPAWQASYGNIKNVVDALKMHPLAGSIPQELESIGHSQYRQVLSGMNRIIYEIRQEVVYIHIVCDSRKEMGALLSRRLLR